jgi:diguanylate cyclase (GGDEF)-like protein
MVRFKSIKSRILAFAVLATLVPSLGLGLLTYWRYQSLVSGNLTVELRTLSNYVRSELDLWIRRRVDDLRTLSNANTILDGLSTIANPAASTRPSGEREIELYLRSVQEKLDSMLELTVLNSEGKMVASSATSPTPVPSPPAAWSNGTDVAGVVQHPPRWDSMRATATLTVVVPVLSFRNEYLGALAAVLDLARLQPRLERITESSAAEVVLLAQNGAPVLGTRGLTTGLSPIDPKALRRMQAQPGEPVTYLGHRGREVFGLIDAPQSSSLSIVAERGSASVYRQRRHLLELFAGLTCALTLLVGTLAYWIGRSIVVPLDGLARAVDRIAAGDLSVRLHTSSSSEIGRLTGAMNTMIDRLRRSHDEVEAAKHALQRQNQLLEELSVTDGLTGLNNRKKLDSILVEQIALFRRHRRPFALLMLDLDHFKALNDTHGHLAGDKMLAQVAAILTRCVRSVDHVARYGGEEFAIVLVDATLEGALDTAERIRSSVQASPIVVNDRSVSVTVSVGATRSRDGDVRPEDVLARADGALYAAKRAGRNRVHCADGTDPPRRGQQ